MNVNRIGDDDPMQSVALKRGHCARIAGTMMHPRSARPICRVVLFVVFGVAVAVDSQQPGSSLTRYEV